jgi:undecaprenyl diphosphate synthase
MEAPAISAGNLGRHGKWGDWLQAGHEDSHVDEKLIKSGVNDDDKSLDLKIRDSPEKEMTMSHSYCFIETRIWRKRRRACRNPLQSALLLVSVLLLVGHTKMLGPTITALAFQTSQFRLARRTIPKSDNLLPQYCHLFSSRQSKMTLFDRLHPQQVPRHVAFICDGNSRWAKERGLPVSAGHVAGADQLVKILDALKESGVLYCTLYTFSTENWKRPPSEIVDLMRIMEASCNRFYDRVMQDHVQVKILGDLEDERIPDSLRAALHKLERDTTEKTVKAISSKPPFTICFCINYGGRKDIVNASLKLAAAIADKQVSPEDVTEDLFASFLSTSDVPDPDLVIRTSGECRLSNYLLWNIAYAELYFANVYWPSFNRDSWQDALQWYSKRTRKFGGRQALEATTSLQRNGVTSLEGM